MSAFDPIADVGSAEVSGYGAAMKIAVVLGIVALSSIVLPPLSATRVACESGNRLLASEQLSFNTQQVEALPGKLERIAAQTGAELLRFETYDPDTEATRKEYRLRASENRYEVIVRETISSGWEVSAERLCQSKTSEGWLSLWSKVIPILKS